MWTLFILSRTSAYTCICTYTGTAKHAKQASVLILISHLTVVRKS